MKRKLKITVSSGVRIFGRRGLALLGSLLISGALTTSLSAKTKIVATSRDLASIATYIGGDKVEVDSLAEGRDDLHYLSARPDFILRTNRADMFLLVGMDLEVGWAPLVLRRSRNAKIQRGAPGYCDASFKVLKHEIPEGEVNRQMGDVHVYGNPHYWTDPLNGVYIGRRIRDCLNRVDPANQGTYNKNYQAWEKKLKSLTLELMKKMRPHFGKKVVVYHREFIYLTKRFKLNQAMSIEAKPGVPPGPARIREVVARIKKDKIPLVLATPWNNLGYAREVARRGGAKLLVLPIQTGSATGTGTYPEMLRKIVDQLADNL